MISCFNTQPPEGGCKTLTTFAEFVGEFQHTAARRRLHHCAVFYWSKNGFNTQPPEGGCAFSLVCSNAGLSFNTQPPEGGCCQTMSLIQNYTAVSTHSRPKAAAKLHPRCILLSRGFNTQPPEGGCAKCHKLATKAKCFNTQPPEGGCSTSNHQ